MQPSLAALFSVRFIFRRSCLSPPPSLLTTPLYSCTASYLFLFIAFYQRTYKKTNTAAAKVAATKVAKKLQ